MRRFCLVVLDGLGVAPVSSGNACARACMPVFCQLERETPSVLLAASGNAVGLPEGQQGASEPGHLTMGAGRVVWQPLEHINRAIRSGAFFVNPALTEACRDACKRNVPLHALILYSNGGVHGHRDHLHAFLALAKEMRVPHVCLHLFGDGRDVPEKSLCQDIGVLENVVMEKGIGTVCSIVGRYYALDRDQNWDRTRVAYDLLTKGKGKEVEDFCDGIKEHYATAEKNRDSDYYLPPLKSRFFVPVCSDHVVVNLNFRSDRERQITAALADWHFDVFDRPVRVERYVCMGPYSETLPVAFPPQRVVNNLGSVLSKHGVRQLRISETEKYAHVTYFFNSQEDDLYPNEDRIHVPSPKVASYDQAPQMSAKEVTDALIREVAQEKYAFILVNYANPDLVGHSGDFAATVTACEVADRELGALLPVLESHRYDWIVVSDHGNAEQMLYPGTDTPCPSHTTNPVRMFVRASGVIRASSDLADFRGLKDIAPLVLRILGLSAPCEMQ